MWNWTRLSVSPELFHICKCWGDPVVCSLVGFSCVALKLTLLIHSRDRQTSFHCDCCFSPSRNLPALWVLSSWKRTRSSVSFGPRASVASCVKTSSFLTGGICFCASLAIVRSFGHLNCARLQQPQEQHYPCLPVCTIRSCVQTMLWLPGFGIFNISISMLHVSAHRHCMNTVRKAALKVDSGREILCCNWESNLH